METFTVCFFGHRQVENPFEIEARLDYILRRLIVQKEYIEFLVGRDGNFDTVASSAIKRAIRSYGYGNTALTLVLPYDRAEYRKNRNSFLNYYDEVEVCEESAGAYYKSAITIRNRIMAERSDLVICCIQHMSGGAYRAVKYAKSLKKPIINVAEDILTDNL